METETTGSCFARDVVRATDQAVATRCPGGHELVWNAAEDGVYISGWRKEEDKSPHISNGSC